MNNVWNLETQCIHFLLSPQVFHRDDSQSLLLSAFINHLDPPCKHLYLQMISIYSAIKKSDVSLADSTSHQATVASFLIDHLQELASYSQEFCHSYGISDLSLNINKWPQIFYNDIYTSERTLCTQDHDRKF